MKSLKSHLLILVFVLSFLSNAVAQQPTGDITPEEQKLCRSDAIAFCFFSVANAQSLRSCLRSNKAKLSAPCQKLITAREK